MDNKQAFYRQAAGILGCTGVGMGAFGAHALKKILETKNTTQVLN